MTRPKKRTLHYLTAIFIISGLVLPLSAATYTVTNTNDSGTGSLRQAILDANTNAGLDTIVFDITAPPYSIQPTSALPNITGQTIIDGWFQGGTGYTGPPLIELNGISAGTSSGLSLAAGSSSSVIRGLVINRFDTNGISITNSHSNRIYGCHIGTNVAGTTAQANNDSGIYASQSNNNIIGGKSTSERNLVSGNGYMGIYLYNCEGNTIEGNFIGTDINGTVAIGNVSNAIWLRDGQNHTVGGTTTNSRNIISGNTDGVIVGSDNSIIKGNYIGPDVTGTSFLGNQGASLILVSSDNTVGGLTSEERNVIAGTFRLVGVFDTGNEILGNYIGTNATGTAALGPGDTGIYLSGWSNTIGGTDPGAGNLISGCVNNGIHVFMMNNNTIAGNYIGTDVTGTAALANGQNGILIEEADNTIVGGTDPNARNIISGNSQNGIRIIDTSTNNTILGNYIGTDVTGTNDLGNGSNGVSVEEDGNTIGGTTPGCRNVISGNSSGIELQSANNNNIQGNYIGTDADGTTGLGNGMGIAFLSYCTNNTVGGTTPGERNLISGNDEDGIHFSVYDTTINNLVIGNYIGTDKNGSVAIPNRYGVRLTHGNTVGGINEAEGNLISGNSISGVAIGGYNGKLIGNIIGLDVSGTSRLGNLRGVIISCVNWLFPVFQNILVSNNTISGNNSDGIEIDEIASGVTIKNNFIGTNSAGDQILGNTGNGIYIDETATINVIGGVGADEPNVIAFNGQNGILLHTDCGIENTISGNSIHSNSSLGIDLGNNGITTNDSGDTDTGANNLQNFPVITNVVRYPSSILIEGSLDSIAGQTYTIEFFSNTALDPSGNGEGETYIGNTSLDIPSGRAVATFSVTLPVAVPAGRYITATATDPNGNTSEFSGGIITPTLALLSDFRAYSASGGVTVEWTTAAENGTAGFTLLRKGENDKQFVPVNPKLLPALPHASEGATYRLIDPSASSGETYIYKLMEVESSGKFRFHGPYKTIVDGKSIHLSSKKAFFKRMDKSFSIKRFNKNLNRIAKLPSVKHQHRLQKRKHFLNKIKWFKKGKKHQRGKITIKEKGLYLISRQQISEMLNLNPSEVKTRIMTHRFQLTNRGHEIPWLPAHGYRGILFFAEAINNVYTNQNVYFLKTGKAKPMGYVPGGFTQATELQTFTDTLHLEQDQYALTALFSDPDADYWLWDYLVAGMAGKDFPFILSSPATTDTATLTVHLKGATPTSHQVKISLNGNPVGQGTWSGTDDHTLELSLDPSLLQNGANNITVTNNSSVSVFYVDSFDLSYERYYQAVNNQLFFNPGENESVTVGGFTDRNVLLFDVTDPKNPKRVMARSRRDGKISFTPASAEHSYLAVAANSLWQPLEVKGVERSVLKKKNKSADYVVIIPQGFAEPAEKLATLRQASGLETLVVELEDIYNEFNHGIGEPSAIKSFLTYTANHWRDGAPRYVVLAGDGSYDYKNHRQHNDCLVPPIMVATPYGLFATDNVYGDIAGEDGVPEVAVGRIPVLTADELAAYVEKLSRYEESQGDWRSRMLFLADNGDMAGNFPADSDSVAKLITNYQVDKVYLSQFPTVVEARAKLFTTWNSGVGLVNFIGHAGLVSLTSEGLFQKGDVAMLQNGDRCGVVTAFTCVMGRFSMPGLETLAESLLLHPTVGAIACWVPSGASLNYLAVTLAEGFYRRISTSDEKSLGEVILKAKAEYATRYPQVYMLHIYNLLGDPAIKIK